MPPPKFLPFLPFLLLLSWMASCARKIDLPQPKKQSIQDESQLVRLVEEERFSIPLSGRTISYEIEYVPRTASQCKFVAPGISYKSLGQSEAIFSNQDQIASILVLKSREIAIIADPKFNILSYSIDRHSLLKPKLPKTNLLSPSPSPSPSRPKPGYIVNPILIATSNEQYIYYLTPSISFVFHYSNVAADKIQFELEGKPKDIYKAIERNGYVLLCAGFSGVYVYKINQETKLLELKQKIPPKTSEDVPIDMQLNQATQLLYVLNDQKTIQVYLFDPSPTPSDKNPSDILTLHDTLTLDTVTSNHEQSTRPNEQIAHSNIEISRARTEQTLMILFLHRGKTIIAELVYNSMRKEYSFVRYFKYSVEIKQIKVIQDVMMVVGEGSLGMFPYGVHPRLIVDQFNGFMDLTFIEMIEITQPPFFIGVSKNTIQYAGVFLINDAGINCHLGQQSTLRQIKFKANLTVCGNLNELSTTSYCQYQKTFIIKQIELTATTPVAASLWIATIIFTLLIVLGICCLFTIQKRKERYIRRLELEFEEKRRKVPVSSDRVQG